MQIYKIDANGFFEEIKHEELNENNELEVTYRYTTEKPPNGFFKPKFINGEWVEGASSNYINSINKEPEYENTLEDYVLNLEFRLLLLELGL